MSFISTRQRKTLVILALLASLVVVLALSAGAGTAAPGAGKPPKNVSGTFQEWNWDLAVDDPGEHAILPIWIKMIEKKYPKVKVVNTSMTLSAQNDKLPLAFAASSSAPTLSQTNEGLENQGRLVQDNLILPLDPYDQIYHWFSKVGKRGELNPIYFLSISLASSGLALMKARPSSMAARKFLTVSGFFFAQSPVAIQALTSTSGSTSPKYSAAT